MDIFSTVKRGPIGILGNGVTGKAVKSFCDQEHITCQVFDERDLHCASLTPDLLSHFPVIVRSPSFLWHHPWVQMAHYAGCLCLTELDLASLFWKGRIIAITGTNGKTTTTEFLTAALQHAGQEATAFGNIGRPFISFDPQYNTPKATAVIEVSSFQMDHPCCFSPHHVLWTNFANDHLEVHSSLSEYFSCKANLIRKVASDPQRSVFVGPSVDQAARALHADDVVGKYTVCPIADDLQFLDYPITTGPQKENFSLIRAFWEHNHLPPSALIQTAETFHLPKHRLQKISVPPEKNTKQLAFWDDSKATNFHALRGALSTFARPVHLIAGGKSKNEPLQEFADIIAGHVKTLYLLGDTATDIERTLSHDPRFEKNMTIHNFQACQIQKTLLMKKIVNLSIELASIGDIILLSPGFSSLDLFESYSERGNLFIESIYQNF